MAGRRETASLKPIDTSVCGTLASFQAVAEANAQVAPQVRSPEAEPATVKAQAAWPVASWLTRRVTPAGWERRHGDKDTLSNWRSPPRPIAKSVEPGRSYNRSPGKATEDERVAEGSVVVVKRGKARGAKGPSCS